MSQEVTVKSTNKIAKGLLTFLLFVVCGAMFYLLLVRFGFLMPPSELPSVLCLSSCKPEQSVHPVIEGERLLNYRQPLKEILGENIASEKVSILIEKSKHRLTVFYALQPVKSYPVVFGGDPSGDKRYGGDQKTPEGIFHVRDLYSHPKWSKFMWLDYPTPQSWREHFQAKLSGEINWWPPIGGQIGIHGVPTGQDILIDKRTNWTWGCISLKNSDVNEIYEFVKTGSLVEILP
jgi:L,D-transpeptidase catalytic domain